MSLAPPPSNPTELADFPSRTTGEHHPYARIHAAVYEPYWFCDCGQHRFDPPPGSKAGFGTCYLAGHPIGAFVERYGDLSFVSRERVDADLLATVVLPATNLADVTNRQALRWGVTGELSAGDYPTAQLWAERLFQAGFGGIWYTAKHDPAGDLHSIALFNKPGLQEGAFVDIWSDRIPRAVINQAREQFGITVIPSSPIA